MSQLTLSLFDTTALSGLTLSAGAGPHFREDPTETASEPEPERVPAHTFRLSGHSALAESWNGELGQEGSRQQAQLQPWVLNRGWDATLHDDLSPIPRRLRPGVEHDVRLGDAERATSA